MPTHSLQILEQRAPVNRTASIPATVCAGRRFHARLFSSANKVERHRIRTGTSTEQNPVHYRYKAVLEKNLAHERQRRHCVCVVRFRGTRWN